VVHCAIIAVLVALIAVLNAVQLPVENAGERDVKQTVELAALAAVVKLTNIPQTQRRKTSQNRALIKFLPLALAEVSPMQFPSFTATY
jgi:hypothetical protein